MERINEFINLLNGNQFSSDLFDFYSNHEYDLFEEWHDINKFSKYYKAYMVDTYMRAPQVTRDMMFNCLKDGNFNPALGLAIIRNLNASVAEVGQNMEGIYVQDFFELKCNMQDPLYEHLLKDDYAVILALCNKINAITLADIKEGKVPEKYNYTFSPEEIEALENAFKYLPLVQVIHSLCDEMDHNYNIYCNYELLNDDFLKHFAFHTDKDNDEFIITDHTGRLMRYYQGDISFYISDLGGLTELTLLNFIHFYRRAETEKDFGKMIDPEGKVFTFDDDKDEEDEDEFPEDYDVDEYAQMPPEIYARVMEIAMDASWNDIQNLSKNYSQRMIDVAKEDLERVDKLVYTYHL